MDCTELPDETVGRKPLENGPYSLRLSVRAGLPR